MFEHITLQLANEKTQEKLEKRPYISYYTFSELVYDLHIGINNELFIEYFNKLSMTQLNKLLAQEKALKEHWNEKHNKFKELNWLGSKLKEVIRDRKLNKLLN